ncbi:MAG: tetratricopeptide repeat protein, partial [Chloroflexaceae bacterium]|nr:tetratricopeptide repeat protein [Chloroflexaceae bacterium]
MDSHQFHRTIATQLGRLYGGAEPGPEGWREAVAWHWEQAGAYREALEQALLVAETSVSELAFGEARRWTEKSLALLNRLADTERQPFAMRAYALTVAVLEFGGQYREALSHARTLLRLAEANGSVEALGRGHLSLGRLQRELGNLAVAEVEMQQALELALLHQLTGLEADVRLQLAKLRQVQGRHLEAFQQLELAQIDIPDDNRGQLARAWTSLGDVYRLLGSHQEALRLYHKALKLDMVLNNRFGQAMLHEKIGHANADMGQHGEALECGLEALRLREALHDTVGQARSHTLLGMIQSRMEQHGAAVQHYEQAQQLQGQTQNPRGQTIALTHLGDAARALGQHERAEASYHEALAIAQRNGDQVGIARMHERLGDLATAANQPEAAASHWQSALAIRTNLGHSEEAQSLRIGLL